MTRRTISLALVLSGLLAGCQTYYAARRDLGIDPADAPPAQPMAAQPSVMQQTPNGRPAPLPGTVLQTREGEAQANWAAQRAAALTMQDNTPPVGYKPEQQASAAAPPAAAGAKAIPAPPAKAVASAAPASMAKPASSPPTAAMAPAMPPPPAGLPAGYKPSPSVVDQMPGGHPPAAPAAAAPSIAQAAPPAAMRDGDAAMPHDVWRAHLASYRSEEEAIAGWEQLLKAEPKLYGRFDPQVLWTDVPKRGVYARLTMGTFADRKAAEAACESVRNPRRYCAPLKE